MLNLLIPGKPKAKSTVSLNCKNDEIEKYTKIHVHLQSTPIKC